MARKILLADDSVTAQNMGRKILTDAGYEVITVNNGSSALKKITEARPDLIVLDVYMPGYSGLEVCQRIKESQDTSQIPVLLTVGKLEPFKQEEARRARADAFIIKPFEATELLAAVGKLQDKLGTVSTTSPAKEGRFATATMASFERVMSESAPKFGDQDSGWKARLKIPAPGVKGREAEEETPASTGASAFRDVAEPPSPASKVASAFPDRPIPTGIPQDITPDEIAAITAAAARVNVGMNVGKGFERFRHESPGPELVVPKDVPTKDQKRESVSENPPAVLDKEIETEAKENAPIAASETAGSMPGAPAARMASEVVSTPPQGSEPPIPQREEKVPEPAMVAVGVVAEPATMAVAGRWIAEEVPLEASEAVLVLEREMHKAFAAFAAAEYAAIPADERGAVDQDDEPMFATMAPPAIGSPVPVTEEPEATSKTEQTEPAATPVAAISSAPVPPLVIRPPAAPFAPAAAMQADEEQHAVAAFGGPDPFGRSEPKNEKVDEAKAQSDTSAAATRADSTSVTRQPEFSVLPETNAASEPIAQAAEAAMAHALKQVESSSKTSEEKKPEAAMAAAASADGSSVSAEANLSSLVDSMLAELKPKLMAELAKKLEQKK